MTTVLVVDDSAVDRRLIGGLLERDDRLTVDYAENGSAALAKIREQPPDVIVTDLQMPQINGLDLVRAVSIHHSDIPVILMTAHGSEELAVAALEQGAASYVAKSRAAEKLLDYAWPGNVRELENCIERAVALAEHEQIVVDDLPEKLRARGAARVLSAGDDPSELVPMEVIERRYIARVLDAVGGNKTLAARILGFDRKTLYRKLGQRDA